MSTFGTWKHKIFDLVENLGWMRRIQNLDSPGSQVLYVLAYHRVINPNNESVTNLDMVSATPGQFEVQMQLIRREYHPVTAADVLDAFDGIRPLPRHAVLVTVDDGYRDFLDTIIPITKKYGVRPVVFVPTRYVGEGTFWWDRLPRALKHAAISEIDTPVGHFNLEYDQERLEAQILLSEHIRMQPFEAVKHWVDGFCSEIAPDLPTYMNDTLNWDDLRQAAEIGADIASHTHTHPILSHISIEEAHREISLSQEIIAREIGTALPIFAFPDGRPYAMNHSLLGVLRSEGIKLAFTRIEGRVQLNQDELLQLPRLGVDFRMDLPQFHFHLTPLYSTLKAFQFNNRVHSDPHF